MSAAFRANGNRREGQAPAHPARVGCCLCLSWESPHGNETTKLGQAVDACWRAGIESLSQAEHTHKGDRVEDGKNASRYWRKGKRRENFSQADQSVAIQQAEIVFRFKGSYTHDY